MQKDGEQLNNMLPSILRTVVAFNMFAIIGMTTQAFALPITSQPIESTAENLAWQAWIMMPPHQQSQEKSRKVTPKSIFVLPNRVQIPAPVVAAEAQQWTGEAGSGSGFYAPIECPLGHRQFESRCIPTLDIDREQLLIQELQALLQQGGGGDNSSSNNNYDYDYDYSEEEGAAAPFGANGGPTVMYKSSSESSSLSLPTVAGVTNYDDGERAVAHQDSPLKFNFFKSNYPTNVDSNHNQTRSVDAAGPETNTNSWEGSVPLLADPSQSNGTETSTVEGEKRVSGSVGSSSTESGHNGTTIAPNTEPSRFSLIDVDAIILPAASGHAQPHEVSLLKDDQEVQLITTVADRQEGRPRDAVATTTKHFDITDLLKADSLLPLHGKTETATITTATATATPLTTVAGTTATATPPPPPTSIQTAAATASATQLPSLATPLTAATPNGPASPTAVNHHPTADTTSLLSTVTHEEASTQPQTLAELLEESDRHSDGEQEEKEDRERSVTLDSLDDETETSEAETTTDPAPPTTFPPSAAETTANEDATTTVLTAESEQQSPTTSKQHAAPEETKVEPVEEEMQGARSHGGDDDDLLASQATPLSTVSATTSDGDGDGDRFGDGAGDRVGDDGDQLNYRSANEEAAATASDGLGRRHTVGEDVGLALEQIPKSTIITTTPPPTTTTTTSATTTTATTSTTSKTVARETDIAEELRVINELVKSRRQAAAKNNTAAAATAGTSESITNITTSTDMQGTTMTETDTRPTPVAGRDVAAADVGSAATLTAEESISSAKTTTQRTTTTPEGSEVAPTLWSKLMPMLGLSATVTHETPQTTVRTAETVTPKVINTATAAAAATATPTATITTAPKRNFSNNANNRNSKIIRLKRPSSSGLSQKAKKLAKPATATASSASTTRRTPWTHLPSRELSPTSEPSDDDSSSPYWWLPISWRVDHPAASSSATNPPPRAAATEQDSSLLLRFWSAFPGHKIRAKE